MLTGCKLTVDGQVDASSVESVVRDVVGLLPSDSSTEERVLALYRYVRRHLFAYLGTIDDAIEPLNKAILTLNWWGFGLCGRMAKTLGMLAAELLGWENVRIVGLRERRKGDWRVGEEGRPYAFRWTSLSCTIGPEEPWGHTSLEVRWDGAWHFLDAMVGFYRRDDAGRIVSLQEIVDRPELVDRPVDDPEGDMPYGPEAEIFTRCTPIVHEPGMNAWAGELPSLDLRPGESFTFLADPIPGEFIVHPQMRARFLPEAVEGGPREGRRNAPQATYGNGLHEYQVSLVADDACPYWCRHSADWRVPVELPYPITSLAWEMTAPGGAPCTGFLHYPPHTHDTLLAVAAAGSCRAGPEALVGRSYSIIVRAPGRRGPADLRLRTVTQHNPLVVPRLRPGPNVVRLCSQGTGRLTARLSLEAPGRSVEACLEGAGVHHVLGPEGVTARQTIALSCEA